MNYKSLLLTGVAVMTTLSAAAIPARRGERTYVQPDGTTITLSLIGDERNHSLVTPDGLAVQRADDGNFYYTGINGITAIKAHDLGRRTSEEAAFILKNATDLQADKVMAGRKAARAQKRSAIRKASQVPNNGSPRVPILLVQYKDKKFIDSDPKSTFESFFSHGDTSAYQYFVDQSNGKYTPQFDVYGPYTLANNRSYYGGNDSDGYDKNLGAMVAEGCNGLNSQIDFSKYDNDGDGECDVVIVLYAGAGEASSDVEDSVWPCQWDLYSSDYGRYLTLDRTIVNKFAVFNEAYYGDSDQVEGIGTFCHEYSHCLGLPDFYDTNYNGHFGMAHWSLMDYGSYNDDGYTPIGYSAYEKEFMGWITIPEADENRYYTLPVFNQKNIDTDQAVKLTNSKNKNEYYIIENRANQGWDKFMPAEGLLIYHVDYLESAWTQNCVNDYDLQRMSPIPADNDLKISKQGRIDETSLLGDLWPYKNATELTDESLPAAAVHTGGYMGKPITEMQRNDDGSISFWAMKADRPSVAMPHSIMHEPEDVDKVTLYWTPGDDNDVTYSIEVNNHKENTYSTQLVLSTVFESDKHDWSVYEGYVKYEDGGLRFGSSKQLGTLISPDFKTDEYGIVSVVFDAKYYGSDGSSVDVSILDEDGYIIDTVTEQLSNKRETHVVYLEGDPDSFTNIVFECTATKKRFYIYNADIYNGFYEDDEMAFAPALQADDDEDYSFSVNGHKDTRYTLQGLKPGVLYECRIKAVPVDVDNYNASPWTEIYTFEHTGTTVVAIDAAENADTVRYYTLQGIYLGNERPNLPGLYIRKTNKEVSKILIR